MTDDDVIWPEPKEQIVDLHEACRARIAVLEERNKLLADIALSALALKLNIEHGFEPTLSALDRDLATFAKRFGGILS